MTEPIEKMLNNYDNNIKLINFYIDMEIYFNPSETLKNINKINSLLAESSRILGTVHSKRYDIEERYQLEFYEKIKEKYDIYENIKDKADIMKGKHIEISSKPSVSGVIGIIKKTDYADMALDSDYNQHLLEAGNNLRQINENLGETSLALKRQTHDLKNIQLGVYETENHTVRAGKIITNISYGQRCQKLLLNMIAILLLILIVILLILKFLK